MNNFTFTAIFFTILAIASAGSTTKILQGPSTKTTIVGPEGSVISAVAPGGQIITEQHPGFVAHSLPVSSSYNNAHIVSQGSYAIPVSHHGIIGNGLGFGSTYSGSTSWGGNAVHTIAADHGYEGQYVHDYTEKLYDDGSYKPHLYY